MFTRKYTVELALAVASKGLIGDRTASTIFGTDLDPVQSIVDGAFSSSP